MTKSFLIAMVIAIFMGTILGSYLFEQYQLETKIVSKETDTTYFFMEGSYNNKEQAMKVIMDNNIKTYLLVKEDANYIIYLAITKSKNNLEKLKKNYKKQNISYSIKKMNIDNNEFLATLQQLDILLKKTNSNEEINAINEVVLANYQEFVLS